MGRANAQTGFEAGVEAAKEGKRPDFITDDHLDYLDSLGESGAVNMFGARSYVQRNYPELTDEQAGAVLAYWMKTFGQESR